MFVEKSNHLSFDNCKCLTECECHPNIKSNIKYEYLQYNVNTIANPCSTTITTTNNRCALNFFFLPFSGIFFLKFFSPIFQKKNAPFKHLSKKL